MIMFERFFRKDTTVSEVCFRMALPGQWLTKRDEVNWRWTFNTEREQITVSVMGVSPGLDSRAQADLAARLMSARREAETAAATGVQLGEMITGQVGTTHVARYEASGPEPERLSTCLLLVNNSLAAVFFYEALGLPRHEFVARGRVAFNSIQLAEEQRG